MKKLLLTAILFCTICATLVAQSYNIEYGHFCVEIKKDGMICPVKNGIVFKDYVWIHIPYVAVGFEDFVNDSITLYVNFQIFQDSLMFANHRSNPQVGTTLNVLICKYDKDKFTITNYWIAHIREKFKNVFNVDNSDIRIVKL